MCLFSEGENISSSVFFTLRLPVHNYFIIPQYNNLRDSTSIFFLQNIFVASCSVENFWEDCVKRGSLRISEKNSVYRDVQYHPEATRIDLTSKKFENSCTSTSSIVTRKYYICAKWSYWTFILPGLDAWYRTFFTYYALSAKTLVHIFLRFCSYLSKRCLSEFLRSESDT